MSSGVVHVVDDDPLVRTSISALLTTFGLTVVEFESAESFLEWLPPEPRGIVITDLRMLGMSGVDLIEKLSAQNCHMPVIVITAFADVALTVQLMRKGAITVLEKPHSSEALRAAVERALEMEPESALRATRASEAERRLATVTEGELDVLKLVWAGQLNKAIAAKLDISSRTVENRRRNLLTKMQAGSVAELLRIVALTSQFSE
jgi:two-component system response regulator FixJ